MATVSAQVNLTNNLFSDFDLNFTKIPGTLDVAKKNNADAIKQSIRNIILTNNYERPFDPNFGSQVSQLLFNIWTPLSKITLQRVIEDCIRNYEPRVILDEVIVNDRSTVNAIDIIINFTIRNVNSPVTMTITLDKVR
jgi:phage baseplate assembly protein W